MMHGQIKGSAGTILCISYLTAGMICIIPTCSWISQHPFCTFCVIQGDLSLIDERAQSMRKIAIHIIGANLG